MPISLTSLGSVIKIDDGSGNYYYCNPDIFLERLNIIDGTTVESRFNPLFPYRVPFTDLIINGSTPTTLSEFESLLETLTGSISTKLNSLFNIGLLSTAITSPVRRVTALGNNADVDQASVPEVVWPGGGVYNWMTGATALEAVSTSIEDSPTGTGMGAISTILLNASYIESVIPVTLNGTTAVPITGTWLRINSAITTTKGSGAPAVRAVNVGDIIIRDAGGGTVRAIIPAGKGILRQCVYTTPAGYSLQIVSQYIGFNRGTGGGTTRYLTVSGYIQNSSGVARLPLDLSCNGESYRHDGIPGITIPEKTDFALEVIAVSADNSDVTAAFLGVLIRNDVTSLLKYP